MRKANNSIRSIWYFVLIVIIAACLIRVFCSCATIQAQKSFSDMTTKEKTVYIMSMYNKQYDEYLSLYQKADLSNEEKETLRKKYDLLKEIYPYIAIYVNYSETGEVPSEVIENKLIDLINNTIQNL